MEIIKKYLWDKKNWIYSFYISLFALTVNIIFGTPVMEYIILYSIGYIISFIIGFMMIGSIIELIFPRDKYLNKK